MHAYRHRVSESKTKHNTQIQKQRNTKHPGSKFARKHLIWIHSAALQSDYNLITQSTSRLPLWMNVLPFEKRIWMNALNLWICDRILFDGSQFDVLLLVSHNSHCPMKFGPNLSHIKPISKSIFELLCKWPLTAIVVLDAKGSHKRFWMNYESGKGEIKMN